MDQDLRSFSNEMLIKILDKRVELASSNEAQIVDFIREVMARRLYLELGADSMLFSKEQWEVLERAKEVVSHSVPSGELSEVITYCANLTLLRKIQLLLPTKKLSRVNVRAFRVKVTVTFFGATNHVGIFTPTVECVVLVINCRWIISNHAGRTFVKNGRDNGIWFCPMQERRWLLSLVSGLEVF